MSKLRIQLEAVIAVEGCFNEDKGIAIFSKDLMRLYDMKTKV